eukprot:12581972-Ditylum_brightwellii.AAC.2
MKKILPSRQKEKKFFTARRGKITCYICGGNHYANKFPDTKKTAKGTTAVTVGDDGSILDGGSWGSNKGLTGIVFCTKGVTRNYKDALMSPRFKPDNVHSTDHVLHQAGEIINKNWVLLDSQSTVNVFCNAKLLINIQKTSRSL